MIRSNPRYKAGIRRFEQGYPEYAPLTREKLAQGIPIEVVIGFSRLAHWIGAGSLQQPWMYLVLVMMEHDFTKYRLLGEDTFRDNKRRERHLRELRRDVRWFYGHFCEGKSPVDIGLAEGYSTETVEKGIKHAREVLRIRKRRGRPPTHHYAG